MISDDSVLVREGIASLVRSAGIEVAAQTGARALGAAVPATGVAAARRTPLYVSVLSPPAPVVGTDGSRHLAYELLLANDRGGQAEIQSVSSRARGSRELQRLSGDQVAGPLENFGSHPTATLGATEGGRMVLDVTLPRRARVPRALVHRFTVRTVSASGESRTWIFRAVSTPVSRRRPVGALAAAARRSLRFAVAGDVTNLDEFLTGAAPAALQPSPRNGLRRSELPLQSSVVRFPG